jgi:hypothetical protein
MRHVGLAMRNPDMPLASDFRALLLKRLQIFFLCVSPSRWKSRQTELGSTDTPRSANRRTAISSSVIPPVASTSTRTRSS